MKKFFGLFGLLTATIGGLFVTALPASAHEHRAVAAGHYHMLVGWKDEPTYSGVRNAVQLFLMDANDQPVTDLGDTLTVQLLFGDQKSDAMPLKAAFGKTWGTPGEYDSAAIPSRPGTYTFHFEGTIHDESVSESFTSSEKTFNNVTDSSAIEFPVKDPSLGELSTRIDRLDPRLAAIAATQQANAATAAEDVRRATLLAEVGIGLAVAFALVALAVFLIGRRRARSVSTQGLRPSSLEVGAPGQ